MRLISIQQTNKLSSAAKTIWWTSTLTDRKWIGFDDQIIVYNRIFKQTSKAWRLCLSGTTDKTRTKEEQIMDFLLPQMEKKKTWVIYIFYLTAA